MSATRTVRLLALQGQAYGDEPSLDPARNRSDYVTALREACEEHRPGFVLLPELFTGPYFASSQDLRYLGLAEPVPGPTTEALATVARDFDTYIAASVFEKSLEGEYYDSCVLVRPDGVIEPPTLVGGPVDGQLCARKVHIPRVEGLGVSIDEKFWFRPGRSLATFDTEFARIGVLICYDRSFPEAWRTLVLAGAELIAIPVASYGYREELFVAELQTMSAQNGVFSLACNRAGPETVREPVSMFGTSCVVSPLGAVVARGKPHAADVVVADIDLDEVQRARQQIGYLRDRRPDAYVL